MVQAYAVIEVRVPAYRLLRKRFPAHENIQGLFPLKNVLQALLQIQGGCQPFGGSGDFGLPVLVLAPDPVAKIGVNQIFHERHAQGRRRPDQR